MYPCRENDLFYPNDAHVSMLVLTSEIKRLEECFIRISEATKTASSYIVFHLSDETKTFFAKYDERMYVEAELLGHLCLFIAHAGYWLRKFTLMIVRSARQSLLAGNRACHFKSHLTFHPSYTTTLIASAAAPLCCGCIGQPMFSAPKYRMPDTALIATLASAVAALVFLAQPP